MTVRGSVSRELFPCPDVLDTFQSLLHLPYPILFDSATAPGDAARYSFAAASPTAVVRAKGRAVEIHDVESGTIVRQIGRGLDIVARLLDRMRGEMDTAADAEEGGADLLPPFQGGAAGYVGYEYGTVLEQIPASTIDDGSMPDLVMGLYDWVVAWDHLSGRAWLIGRNEGAIESVAKVVRERPPNSLTHETGRRGSSQMHGSMHRGSVHDTPYKSTFTKRGYIEAIRQVQSRIRGGEIFQANLSQRFHAPLPRSPHAHAPGGAGWELYCQLRAINPAPFASYFDFGNGAIAGASPERFLLAGADGSVETRPIKGTRPRHATAALDNAAGIELVQSQKDAAEHVMIVDVLRNDLSRVCAAGSVRVPALMSHQRYTTVHHLVSTITGRLRPGMDAIALLHACFPGGSITGAPKIRAMEIIARLEPVTRGAYCGTMGYISTTGAMDTSILIRTYTIVGELVYFSAGGGIVADSVPDEEYTETLVKAHALMEALDG